MSRLYQNFFSLFLALVLLLGDVYFLKASNEVVFKYKHPQAKQIKIYGSFNGWAKGYTLKRVAKGTWKQSVEMERGRYEYKYLVDGKWKYDTAAPSINDGLYGKNNVIYVR